MMLLILFLYLCNTRSSAVILPYSSILPGSRISRLNGISACYTKLVTNVNRYHRTFRRNILNSPIRQSRFANPIAEARLKNKVTLCLTRYHDRLPHCLTPSVRTPPAAGFLCWKQVTKMEKKDVNMSIYL